MYELLGICLALAGLLGINLLASTLVAGLWRCLARVAGSWESSTRAQFLFLLRIAPSVAAIACVGAFFVPAYLANEPRQTTEIVTAKLGLLAALSLYGIGFALWRGFATCFTTRRLVRNWMQHAEPVRIADVTIPAFRIQHRFPVVAIVGAVRPKLFVAAQLFHALDATELSIAMAHEEGHLVARDNIKRGLLRACRDILSIIPLGRRLDQAWIEATEWAADEYAAKGGAAKALDLASALVKIARIAPSGLRPSMPAGASLIAEDLALIRARALRLTRIPTQPARPKKSRAPALHLAAGVCFSLFLAVAILTVLSSDRLALIHAALERIVSMLQ